MTFGLDTEIGIFPNDSGMFFRQLHIPSKKIHIERTLIVIKVLFVGAFNKISILRFFNGYKTLITIKVLRGISFVHRPLIRKEPINRYTFTVCYP